MSQSRRQAQRLFEGVKFSVDRVQIDTRDGGTVTRELAVHPGAVIVLPLLEDGEVVLIRHHRLAVGQTLWELCAGTLEEGEPPVRCATRELIEETGYKATRVEPLTTFYTSPGFTDETMHAFVATGLSQVGQQLEATEKIEVHTRSFDEALAMIRDGQIVDGKSIATLLFYHAFTR